MGRAKAMCGLAVIGVLVSACARGPELEWMKTGPYTTAEFERDVEACTRSGDLNSGCMESRGWIQVHPDPTLAPKKPKPPPVPAR